MTMRNVLFGSAATLAVLGLAAGDARASSHRESLAIINDPCVDNTDVYAWVTPGTHDKLYLIAGYNGLHEPGQGNHQTRLCDNVLYEFHITRGVNDLQDRLTYQVLLSSTPPTPVDPSDLTLPVGGGKELLVQLSGVQQTFTVTKVEREIGRPRTVTTIGTGLSVAPANIGPRTDRIAYGLGGEPFDIGNPAHSTVGLYDDAFAARYIHNLGTNGSEGRVFVGTRDDGFYLDEKGIFDIINLQAQGVSEDVFAGFNLNVIAIEIPIEKVTGTGAAPAHNGTPGDDTLIGVWASASRRKFRVLLNDGEVNEYGSWVQVGREGLPLVNAGLIGAQDQPRYLRTTPATDVENFAAYFLNPVLVRDIEFLGIYNALGVPQATVDALKTNRADILQIINLDNIPSMGAHHVPIEPGKTGDVLRLDIATDSQFPNGRMIPGGARPDAEQVDVSDVLVSVIVVGATEGISDGVSYNDKPYLTEFPFLALPHQGLYGGHGAPTP